jgi:hypothetical protein
LKSDGHQILIKWISHFRSEHNHAFLLDTLNILGHLPFNIDNISQNDIDELQLKIAELASAESGEEKGQCFWYKYQMKKKNLIQQMISYIKLLVKEKENIWHQASNMLHNKSKTF